MNNSNRIFNHQSGQYFTCGTAELYVEEISKHNEAALILLHGGFGDIEDFNTLTPILSQRFRLIGIDSRGHGKSTLGTQRLSYDLLAQDFLHIIKQLGLSQYSILGFSDGGTAAYHLAAKQDHNLDKLITVGSAWEMAKGTEEWQMLSAMNGEIWRDMFPVSYASYMHLNPEANYDKLAENIISMWLDLSHRGYPTSLMKQIKCQLLVMRGDKDPLTSLSSMAKLQTEIESMNFFNIPFAEHVAFDDTPELFLPAIARFLHISFE